MPAKHIVSTAVLFCVIQSDGALIASQQGRSNDEARFEFYVRSMLDVRQKIRSGKVKFKGVKRRRGEKATAVEGPVKGTYLFDKVKECFRFEWTEPCDLLIASPGKRILPSPERQGAQYSVKYRCCRTPEYFADWSQLRQQTMSSLVLRSLDYDSRDKSATCGRRPFDPLAAGVMGYRDFLHGRTLVDVYEGLLTKTVKSLNAQGTRVTMELEDERSAYTLVVDLDRFVPLSWVTRPRLDESWKHISRAEWATVEAGEVIPTRLSQELIVADVSHETDEYELNWSRINDDFKLKEFEYTAFTGLPAGVVEVLDERSEDVKHLGTWVRDGEVRKPDKPSLVTETDLRPTPNTTWLPYMIGLNIVFVVALVALRWMSSRAKRNQSGAGE